MPWRPQDVTDPRQRPGTYVNFLEQAQALISGGVTGVVAAIVTSAWGKAGEVVEIRNSDDIRKNFTLREDDFEGVVNPTINDRFSAPYVLNQLLQGGVSRVLAYRVVGPVPVSATVNLQDNAVASADLLSVTSKYSGVGGNFFTISVGDTPNATTKRLTLSDPEGIVVGVWDESNARRMRELVNGDESNDYIVLEVLGTPTDQLGDVDSVSMAGGNGDEGNIVVGNYVAAQSILSQENFEMLYVDAADSSVLNSFIAWIHDLEDEGKMRMIVIGSQLGVDTNAAITDADQDDPSVVYIYPGAKQRDQSEALITYPGNLFASNICGIMSGLPLGSSPTFKSVSGVEDLEVRPSNLDIRDLLAGNITPIVWNGRRFRIERGITTYQDDDSYYKKIKTTRILYNIANAINLAFDEDVIGEVNNDEDGRNGAINVVSEFLDIQVDDRLIEPGYIAEIDPSNSSRLDRFFLRIGLLPIDSIEYVYFTIAVGARIA